MTISRIAHCPYCGRFVMCDANGRIYNHYPEHREYEMPCIGTGMRVFPLPLE